LLFPPIVQFKIIYFDEFKTLLLVLAPMFASYVTISIRFLMSIHRKDTTDQEVVSRALLFAAFGIPFAFTLFISILILHQANGGQGAWSFEQFQRLLLTFDTIASGWTGEVIYRTFSRDKFRLDGR